MHRVYSRATLRVGDRFYCPQCKTISTLLGGHTLVMIFGKAVACIDDRFSCGARLLGNQEMAVMDTDYNPLQALNHITPNQSRFSPDPYLHKTALTNNSVDQDTERLNGHYYNIDTGVFEGKITDEKKRQSRRFICVYR